MKPIFTGHYKRLWDAHLRLRLPTHWAAAIPQWLLFPPSIFMTSKPLSKELHLVPADEPILRKILTTRSAQAVGTPTIEAALSILRASAVNNGLDPLIATTIQTLSTSNRLVLTRAQAEWLDCEDRTLVFVGALNRVTLHSWKRWHEIDQKEGAAVFTNFLCRLREGNSPDCHTSSNRHKRAKRSSPPLSIQQQHGELSRLLQLKARLQWRPNASGR